MQSIDQGEGVGSRGPVYAVNRAPTLWIDEWGLPKSWFEHIFMRKTSLKATLRDNAAFSALKPYKGLRKNCSV